jgi:hypothetical protein
VGVIVDHDDEVAAEQTVVRVDINTAEHEFLILRDDTSEVVDNTDIIITDDPQGDGIL